MHVWLVLSLDNDGNTLDTNILANRDDVLTSIEITWSRSEDKPDVIAEHDKVIVISENGRVEARLLPVYDIPTHF